MTELAYEAQDELLDDAPDTADNSSAFYLRNKSGNGELRGADLVEYATRIVGEDLLSRARSAIAIGKGRGYEPSEEELRETVLGFAVKMAEGFQLHDEEMANGDGHGDEDPDYNPNNAMNQQYAAEDAVDDLDERTSAPLHMSKSALLCREHLPSHTDKSEQSWGHVASHIKKQVLLCMLAHILLPFSCRSST